MNKGIPKRSDAAIQAFVESMAEQEEHDCYIYWKIDEERNRSVVVSTKKSVMQTREIGKSGAIRAIDFVEKHVEHVFPTLNLAARFIAEKGWTVDAAPESMIGSDDLRTDYISANDWTYFFEQYCRWQGHFAPDDE